MGVWNVFAGLQSYLKPVLEQASHHEMLEIGNSSGIIRLVENAASIINLGHA